MQCTSCEELGNTQRQLDVITHRVKPHTLSYPLYLSRTGKQHRCYHLIATVIITSPSTHQHQYNRSSSTINDIHLPHFTTPTLRRAVIHHTQHTHTLHNTYYFCLTPHNQLTFTTHTSLSPPPLLPLPHSSCRSCALFNPNRRAPRASSARARHPPPLLVSFELVRSSSSSYNVPSAPCLVLSSPPFLFDDA